MRGIERRVAIDHGSGCLLLYPIENTWLVCCSLGSRFNLFDFVPIECVCGRLPKTPQGGSSVRPSVGPLSKANHWSRPYLSDATPGPFHPCEQGDFTTEKTYTPINETRRRKKGRMASRRTRWNCERSATPEKRKWTDFGDVSITVAKLHPCEKKVSI